MVGQLVTMKDGIQNIHVEVSRLQIFATQNLTPQDMTPDQIPLGYYTHINFAFSLLDPSTFNLVAMATYMQSLYDQVANLKLRQSNLQVWISIGGWTFNDPGNEATMT